MYETSVCIVHRLCFRIASKAMRPQPTEAAAAATTNLSLLPFHRIRVSVPAQTLYTTRSRNLPLLRSPCLCIRHDEEAPSLPSLSPSLWSDALSSSSSSSSSSMLDAHSIRRYSRQLLVPQFGVTGTLITQNSSVFKLST